MDVRKNKLLQTNGLIRKISGKIKKQIGRYTSTAIKKLLLSING